jgi:hypothetical protein
VRSYRTVSPITESAGLFSVALVVVCLEKQTPGRYPARCPLVFGLSSFVFWTKAIARLAPLQGCLILLKLFNIYNLSFR